jgi:ABC-type lipoprotein release transport system permease subunit
VQSAFLIDHFFTAVTTDLFGTATLAIYLPARAAMAVDPVQALKYD